MSLTVKQLYKQTKEIMFEKASSTTYDSYVVGNLNLLLSELFDENNIARVFNGKSKLREPQRLPDTNYQDIELIYEDDYLYKVLPYGLAAQFFIDDDLNKYSIYSTKYNNARVMAQKVVSLKRFENATSE